MKRSVVVCVVFASSAFAGAPWSMADLEAAAGQGSWAEVLERAEDVPPSGRTDKWRALVSDAAASTLEKVTPTADKPFAVAEKADALVARYAFLEKATRFGAVRGKATQSTLDACVKANRDDCLDKLKSTLDALTGAAALDAARSVRKGWQPAAAMKLVQRAVQGQASLCSDPLTAEVTLAGLELPEDGELAAAARNVAFEVCWSPLSAALKKSQLGASKYRLANACAAMRAKKALTEMQDDLCKDEER